MKLPLALNPALQSLPVYQPGRPIEEVARELGLKSSSIIKLASNENPLGPSPAALRAMQAALTRLNLYPDGNAFVLKQKLARRFRVGSENLVLGNGSNEIIEFIGHALMRPGADVVVSQYCFAIYPLIAKLFGANVITVPAKNFGHDILAMLKAITQRTTVLFVANPNNPTGTLAPRTLLRRLIREVPANVLLVLDEAYIEYLPRPLDLLPLIRSGKMPNLLLMRTFSKIYGLAGLRLGYGIGHCELIAALEKVRQPFNINALVQAGAVAALDDRKHITRTKTNNEHGRKFFETAFRKWRLEFVPSAANFVLVRVGAGERCFRELQQRGVITRPMGGYQLPEWLRISIGTESQNQRCLQALRQVLGQN